MEVRKADVYDAEMVSRIGKISFRQAFGNVFNAANLEQYLNSVYNPDKIAINIHNRYNTYFIAELDERPVGFAKVKKFSLNDDIESGLQMQLEKIYVLPEYQNKGAGTALLQKAIAMANIIGPDYLWLDVYAGNEKAILFYEKNGFKTGSLYHQGFGSQFFEFRMMMLPVNVNETLFCNN